jgi:hypothetical protein
MYILVCISTTNQAPKWLKQQLNREHPMEKIIQEMPQHRKHKKEGREQNVGMATPTKTLHFLSTDTVRVDCWIDGTTASF